MDKFEMYKKIALNFFDPQSRLSAEEIKKLFVGSRILNFNRMQVVSSEGSEDKDMYFIFDGIMRTYTQRNNSEITNSFFEKYSYLGDPEYLLNSTKLPYSIQAIKPSEVLAVSVESNRKLLETSLTFNNLCFRTFSTFLRFKVNKESELGTLTTMERLIKLKTEMPAIYEAVPDNILATYIGCTPVQLSRLTTKLKEMSD